MGRPARALAVLAVVSAVAPALAAPSIDPLKALPLLLKVLTYDRNFHSRGSGEFVVLVPSEPGKDSARDEILVASRTLGLTSIQNRPLRFVAGELKDASGLDDSVQRNHAQAILAVPGLSAASVKAISDVAQTNQIYTLALDPAFVDSSLALGVSPKEDGKPQIVINLGAAKAVGAVFENSVLRLARLVQ